MSAVLESTPRTPAFPTPPATRFPPQDFTPSALIRHASTLRDGLIDIGLAAPSPAAILFLWAQLMDTEFKRLIDSVSSFHPDARDGLTDIAGALEVLSRAVPPCERVPLALAAFRLARFER